VSFEDDGSGNAVVRQENSYYPFGMGMPGNYVPTLPNKHLYNAGSEWQDEFDIANYYSTFFREYDPTIGRFNSVDPLAEASASLSVYHYAANNPVNFNDPLGLKVVTQEDLDALLNSPNGGHWDSESGLTFFSSQDEAFMAGAMQMEQNGWWGGGGSGSGWANSFAQALKRYNGGRVTTGMVAAFYSATWGFQASNISARETTGGFYVSFTATSTGNRYPNYFVSTNSILEYFTILASLDDGGQGGKSKNQSMNMWSSMADNTDLSFGIATWNSHTRWVGVTGFGLTTISTGFTAYKVYNQLRRREKVDLSDKISLTLGGTHIVAATASYFGVGGAAAVASITGTLGTALGLIYLDAQVLAYPFDRLEAAARSQTTGNPQADDVLNDLRDKGMTSWPDGGRFF
jgi:RHS repeat-associated protein